MLHLKSLLIINMEPLCYRVVCCITLSVGIFIRWVYLFYSCSLPPLFGTKGVAWDEVIGHWSKANESAECCMYVTFGTYFTIYNT